MRIVQNAVDISRLLGVEKPKVAAISATEKNQRKKQEKEKMNGKCADANI